MSRICRLLARRRTPAYSKLPPERNATTDEKVETKRRKGVPRKQPVFDLLEDTKLQVLTDTLAHWYEEVAKNDDQVLGMWGPKPRIMTSEEIGSWSPTLLVVAS